MKTDISQLIPNFKQPRPQLVTGGQPEADAWKQLADAGIKTVINLRPASELPGRDEAKEVSDANLTYINLPVEGTGSLNKALTDQLWQTLNNVDGGVLIHCGTGNRCGAMLALTEAWFRKHSTEDAIAFGKQAGLTGMEPAVRELLEK